MKTNAESNVQESSNNREVPQISNVIGRVLPRIGPYKKLDNTKQVVALIDDVNNR